jgi:hypothetical protein
MEKLSRSQLPDSSSSPPLSNIFQSFDDEAMSDLPSCIYANAHHHHHHHHQINHLSIPNALNTSSGMSPSPPPLNPNPGNLRLNVNSFRQIQQHFMQQHNEISEIGALAASSSSSLHNFNNSPAPSQARNQRQQGSGGGPIRERKQRTARSAPNGYLRINASSNFT